MRAGLHDDRRSGVTPGEGGEALAGVDDGRLSDDVAGGRDLQMKRSIALM